MSASGFRDRFVFNLPPIVEELPPPVSAVILLLLGPLLLLLPLLLPLTDEIFVVTCEGALTTSIVLDVEGTA